MKVSFDELLTQIKEMLKDNDDDLAISLLENASDTLVNTEGGLSDEEVEEKIAEAVQKTETEWKKKYHDRFYNNDDTEDEDVSRETFEEKEDGDERKTREEMIEEMLVERSEN